MTRKATHKAFNRWVNKLDRFLPEGSITKIQVDDVGAGSQCFKVRFSTNTYTYHINAVFRVHDHGWLGCTVTEKNSSKIDSSKFFHSGSLKYSTWVNLLHDILSHEITSIDTARPFK